ncbi:MULTISPECIES: LacI family DNA-binding transcriptional regulator [Isoptericola]|uniref:LacI family DNA-binding transcriptional regulator n=1 Tax=Isoptericola haloaureus TaxID=1542902 RepID=A0ABU7Z940_9MICO|nr:LacI family DNA-binding transcriptional regulator [Isoptericola sp. AK164]
MAVTMHDVAQRAGVSIKTVSNVVNGYPHIRPETRRRVQDAIDELGYRLNTTARNLRQGRTGMIGLALPELSLPYFAELADSVMRAAEARGVVVLLEQTGAQRERELQALDSPHRRLTDGLLFSPLALEPEETERLQVDYPMVLLGERMFGPVDHVTMANVEAARAATLHLVERGCRRIATVGAHPGETMGSARLRLDGYRKALAEAGLPFDPDLVADAGLWHRSTGAEAMTRLLDAGVQLDGVFAMNDALALGALHVLHTRGVAVPRDVAVIGFDDIDDARYSEPLLSTVDPGREQIAGTAVDLLLERIAGSTVAPRRVVADFRIVARESCLLGQDVH